MFQFDATQMGQFEANLLILHCQSSIAPKKLVVCWIENRGALFVKFVCSFLVVTVVPLGDQLSFVHQYGI